MLSIIQETQPVGVRKHLGAEPPQEKIENRKSEFRRADGNQTLRRNMHNQAGQGVLTKAQRKRTKRAGYNHSTCRSVDEVVNTKGCQEDSGVRQWRNNGRSRGKRPQRANVYTGFQCIGATCSKIRYFTEAVD